MKYELAKKLREVGFPEITRIGRELNLFRYRRPDIEDAASEPFLQEILGELPSGLMIYKCGHNLWSVCLDSEFTKDRRTTELTDEEISMDKRQAFDSYEDTETYANFYGRTLEEAASRLYIWLKLNKQDK